MASTIRSPAMTTRPVRSRSTAISQRARSSTASRKARWHRASTRARPKSFPISRRARAKAPKQSLKTLSPTEYDMANVTAPMVKDLRDKTGAGMMDCKAALAETNGDIEAAIDWLRKKGLAKAAKKSSRVAAEGLIGIAVGGDSGVVVEVN